MSEFLNLKQSAVFLGICESRARRTYTVWRQYGVKIYGTSRWIKFKRSELEVLKEKKVYA